MLKWVLWELGKKALRITGLRVAGARAVVFNQGKVLLVRHRGNATWSLPGGGVSAWEDPAKAAQRELLEELCLPTPLGKPLGVYTTDHHSLDSTIHIYVTETANDFGKLSFELTAAGWFNPQDLPQHTSGASQRRILEALGQKPRDTTW